MIKTRRTSYTTKEKNETPTTSTLLKQPDKLITFNNTLITLINQLNFSLIIYRPDHFNKRNFLIIESIRKNNQIVYCYDEWCERNEYALELAQIGFFRYEQNGMHNKEVIEQLKLKQIYRMIEIIEKETIIQFPKKHFILVLQ